MSRFPHCTTILVAAVNSFLQTTLQKFSMNISDEQISSWVDQVAPSFGYLPKDTAKSKVIVEKIKQQFIESFHKICSHYDSLIHSPSYQQGCRLNPLPPNSLFYELNIKLYLATLRMFAKTEKDIKFLMPPVIHILLLPDHRAVECFVTPCDRPPAEEDDEDEWMDSEPQRLQAFNLICTKLLQPGVPRQMIRDINARSPFTRGYRSLGLSRYLNERNWFMSYVDEMQGSGSPAVRLAPANEIASYLSDGQRAVKKGRAKYNPDRFDQEPYPNVFDGALLKPISHYMTMRGLVVIGVEEADDLTWLEFQRYYNMIQNGVAIYNDVEDVKALNVQRVCEMDKLYENDGDQFLNKDGVKVNRVIERCDINEAAMNAK